MKTNKKQLVIGMLAHVDAGKTTLSEGLLYLGGILRKPGRVDHGDAFLDTYAMEKERGITIFSKQAVLETGDAVLTLMDTPGHVDFSAEMERTLKVLDYAVLVISAPDGVQGHTMTLWKLLWTYGIPTFLFINKMDQPGTDRQTSLAELKARLSPNCVDFDPSRECEAWQEEIAVCDETVLEGFLETGELKENEIREMIAGRKLFPCFFGSALQMDGVQELLDGLERWTEVPACPEEFGAKVFKIARDEKGNRLTYLKVTGGSLAVKTQVPLHSKKEPGGELMEKADQLRLYSGARYEVIREATPGMVCAATGFTATYPGQGLGFEPDADLPVLSPVLSYQVLLPDGCDVHQMLRSLKLLEEEDPQLHIVWEEQSQEIHAMLMGEVQIEILRRLIWERFHVAADFGAGHVVYRETIESPVEGVGHFEPLRHYAEVHLLLEPGERGSGLQFFTACSEDVLDRNWQRLILTHLEEKEHLGVLTGSPITDMQITLLTGRAHVKHTEGGDFRQATYRAVRQGLRKARSVLLEPYYGFTLEIPAGDLGRAMSDIRKRNGECGPPEQEGDICILRGRAPVQKMRDYPAEVMNYTSGPGRIFFSLDGYEPCREQEEIVADLGYDPDADLENPTGSVFCAHGAGYIVPWYEVESHMHLPAWEDAPDPEERVYEPKPAAHRKELDGYAAEEELRAIFERTFGPVKSRLPSDEKRVVRTAEKPWKPAKPRPKGEEYLLVDGYNMIFAWEELRKLAKENIHAAQDRLKDILSNYQGLTGGTLILVFDAYKVEDHPEEISRYNNIYVVFTKTAETADQYIEKTVHRIGRAHQVTVATSDGLEQIIIMGQGAQRMSAAGLKETIEESLSGMDEGIRERRQSSRSYLLDNAGEDVAEYLEQLRLGKKQE